MNMKALKGVLILWFFLMVFPAFSNSPMELVSGSLRLVVFPATGGFCIYDISDVGRQRHIPLFDDRNSAATSFFSVNAGGRVFRLGRRVGRPLNVEQFDDRIVARFQTSDDFFVDQVFSFVYAPGTTSAWGVKIETHIENTSGKPLDLALRLLLDTTLGENEGIHFFTDQRPRISAETRITPSDSDRLIVSRNKQASLMWLLDSQGATRPALLQAANWERLNILSWEPDFVDGRSFNSRYTVNDSALMAMWPSATVSHRQSVHVVTILGRYDEQLFGNGLAPSTPVVVPLAPVRPVTPAPVTPSAPELPPGAGRSRDGDLLIIEQLLARIDEIEANPGIVSDDELDTLIRSLDVMLERLKDYE